MRGVHFRSLTGDFHLKDSGRPGPLRDLECPKAGTGIVHCIERTFYLAYSTALVSRITVTLIWPGYASSFSIFLAISLQITKA
jgi:hypothetical protein